MSQKTLFPVYWKDWIRLEHQSPRETTQFLESLPFPQREALAPFITNPNWNGLAGAGES